MNTVSMVVRITPEQKALHLVQELAEINQGLSALKEQFQSRSNCEHIKKACDDLQEFYHPHADQVTSRSKQTCRDLNIEHCPRCQQTEPLAQQWQKLKGKQRNTLNKIHTLGCLALDGI